MGTFTAVWLLLFVGIVVMAGGGVAGVARMLRTGPSPRDRRAVLLAVVWATLLALGITRAMAG